MLIVKLQYGNKIYAVIKEQRDKIESLIKVVSYENDLEIDYCLVMLSKDPKSCSITMTRNNIPYAIIRPLMHVVEKEIERLGIKLDCNIF